MAVQPHRRTRPRRLLARRGHLGRHRRRGPDARSGAHRRTGGDDARPRRVRRAEQRPRAHDRDPRARRAGARRADRGHSPRVGRRHRHVPSTGRACRGRQRVHPGRAVRERPGRPCARRAPPGAARVAGRTRQLPGHQPVGRHRVAAGPPAGHGRARLHDVARHGRPGRRLRPCPHRRSCRGTGRHHQADRAVLRRRQPDARLPHAAGPHRAPHQQRPAVQGRRAGPRQERLHRPHPHP